MKRISESDLEKVEQSLNPKISIHVYVFNKYEELGYDQTQDWIKYCLQNWQWNKYFAVQDYLKKRISLGEQFEPYRQELLKLTLALKTDKLESWVYRMKEKDFSKKSIFNILSELFVFVQYHPSTKHNNAHADFVADFLDGFTAWGKHFRILPDEPDCK